MSWGEKGASKNVGLCRIRFGHVYVEFEGVQGSVEGQIVMAYNVAAFSATMALFTLHRLIPI